MRVDFSRFNTKHITLQNELNETKGKMFSVDSKQQRFLRDVADYKFNAMQVKVAKMRYEIFHEIMETEMVMTGLCDENFSKYIPKDIEEKQNNSLLKRMNTMKAQIMTKRLGRGYVPDENDDSSSSSEEEHVESRDATKNKDDVSNSKEDDSNDDQDVSKSILKESGKVGIDGKKKKKKTGQRKSTLVGKQPLDAKALQPIQDKLTLLSMQLDMVQKEEKGHV